jgi:hypothetical protein
LEVIEAVLLEVLAVILASNEVMLMVFAVTLVSNEVMLKVLALTLFVKTNSAA